MTTLSPYLSWIASLPDDAIEPPSARSVLTALAIHADSGCDNPTEKELKPFAGCSIRSVERHIKVLAPTFIEIDSGRAADGTKRANRYRLKAPPHVVADAHARLALLEVFSLTGEQQWAAIRHLGADHLTSDQEPRATTAESNRHGLQVTAPMSGGAYREHAREHARLSPSIHPAILSYPWPTDEVRAKAVRIFEVCGPGMGNVNRYAVRMLPDLQKRLQGPWADDEFFRLEVLPMVDKKTEEPREEKKRHKDFSLIAQSIEEDLRARAASGCEHDVHRPRGSSSSSMKGQLVATFAAQNSEPRNVILRRIIDRIRRGNSIHTDVLVQDRTDFLVGTEKERAAAASRALTAYEAELAKLEAQLGIPKSWPATPHSEDAPQGGEETNGLAPPPASNAHDAVLKAPDGNKALEADLAMQTLSVGTT